MQNSVMSTWITCLYVSQLSSVVFDCKTAHFGLELQVSMGPRPHLWFLHAKHRLLDQHTSVYGYQTEPVVLCLQNSVISTWKTCLYVSQPSSVVFAWKTASLGPKLHVSMGPSPHLWFSAWKTACLASELLVSMGPRPYVWFMDAKQRLLARKNKSL